MDTSAPAAGASLTLNATVRNQGNGRSDSTMLRYYQSTDSTITTGDTEVGTDSVFRLDASGSGAESISVTAPSTAGTYYYGACVDAVSEESDTTNNCSPAVAVVVGAAPAPDLVVDTPTVDTSAPAAGARFTLSATVRNQGSGASDSTTLRYYQSSDSTITTGDTEVGTDSVFRLEASASGAESISPTAPSCWHVLLRRMRRLGVRGVRHDKQLLQCCDGDHNGASLPKARRSQRADCDGRRPDGDRPFVDCAVRATAERPSPAT